MKILIIDDEPFMRLLLKDYLLEAGYEDVKMVNSAEEAFKLLGMNESTNQDSAYEVDCILMDIVMTGADGIEACKKITSDPKYHDVPIVMVTSMDGEKLVKSALEAGAVDFLQKPVNRTELVARINTMGKFKEKIDRHKEKEEELKILSKDLEKLNAKLKESNVELEKYSPVDQVTGIASKFRFDEHFFVEWKRATRYQTSLAIILINFDSFDAYQKECGREKTDESLKIVAKRLASRLQRPADLVAHYTNGGFATILPDTDLAGAKIVAEASMKSLKALNIKNGKSQNSKYLTISIGIVSLKPTPKMRPAEIMDAAKAALKAAKDKEGNNIQSYVYTGKGK